MAISVPLVQTASREVNQLQHNIIQRLVPAINSLLSGPSLYTSDTMPSATAAWQFIRVRDAGQPEQLLLSLQKADGSYGWATVVIAPP